MTTRTGLATAALALGLAAVGAHAQLAGPVRLNDTGAVLCVKADGTTTPHCAGTGQDGATGRDATVPAAGNGHGGFKFTKLDAGGHPLPADAPRWRCVADQVSGLVWEVKTDEGGVDGAGWSYTNQGTPQKKRDTARLVADVNAKHLCGADDWRLPTIEELQGIVDYGVAGTPMVDARFFPFLRQTSYWTSTGYANDPLSAWAFDFSASISGDGAGRRTYRLPAMLVHPSRFARPVPDDGGPRYTFEGDAGDEVVDHWTRLAWRRCSAGQAWDGTTCTGRAKGMDWARALREAADESTRTGLAWRVPNQKELSTIADRTRNYPAIDLAVFPNTPAVAYYWTSTPWANDPTWAFTIDIRGGYTQPLPMTGEAFELRLVRDVQPTD